MSAVYKYGAYAVGLDVVGVDREELPKVCIVNPWWHDAAIAIGAAASAVALLKLAKKK